MDSFLKFNKRGKEPNQLMSRYLKVAHELKIRICAMENVLLAVELSSNLASSR